MELQAERQQQLAVLEDQTISLEHDQLSIKNRIVQNDQIKDVEVNSDTKTTITDNAAKIEKQKSTVKTQERQVIAPSPPKISEIEATQLKKGITDEENKGVNGVNGSSKQGDVSSTITNLNIEPSIATVDTTNEAVISIEHGLCDETKNSDSNEIPDKSLSLIYNDGSEKLPCEMYSTSQFIQVTNSPKHCLQSDNWHSFKNTSECNGTIDNERKSSSISIIPQINNDDQVTLEATYSVEDTEEDSSEQYTLADQSLCSDTVGSVNTSESNIKKTTAKAIIVPIIEQPMNKPKLSGDEDPKTPSISQNCPQNTTRNNDFSTDVTKVLSQSALESPKNSSTPSAKTPIEKPSLSNSLSKNIFGILKKTFTKVINLDTKPTVVNEVITNTREQQKPSVDEFVQEGEVNSYEIKISESPVVSVNDCAPFPKDTDFPVIENTGINVTSENSIDKSVETPPTIISVQSEDGVKFENCKFNKSPVENQSSQTCQNHTLESKINKKLAEKYSKTINKVYIGSTANIKSKKLVRISARRQRKYACLKLTNFQGKKPLKKRIDLKSLKSSFDAKVPTVNEIKVSKSIIW